jgi:hypothetical protein
LQTDNNQHFIAVAFGNAPNVSQLAALTGGNNCVLLANATNYNPALQALTDKLCKSVQNFDINNNFIFI